MVAGFLTEALAELTGEELFNLLGHLIDAEQAATLAAHSAPERHADIGQAIGLMDWLTDARIDALSQLGRITVPIREAQAIIWRAVYSRNHPVRVPGT